MTGWLSSLHSGWTSPGSDTREPACSPFHKKPHNNHGLHTKPTAESGLVCTVLGTLKGLWGVKRKPKISMPFNATHVNHIHFDVDLNKWRWNEGYPETMALLPDAQKDVLSTFIRQLCTELDITWKSKDQYDETKPPLTHQQATRCIQQVCKTYDPRFTYQSWSRIGEGASGIVFCANNKQNVQVAIKRIRLCHHPRHDLLLNEIMVAKSPNCHPNIVQHIESYLWHDCIWIVMEFMDGGSLTDIVTNRYMFESEMATVCREVLQGLDHLHSHRIIHRDIKSDNILISRQGHIKLSDFGYSAQLDSKRLARNTIAGTPCWMAPEIVANEPYGCKVDIWSFGITVIEMIESKPPYFSQPDRATTMLKLKQQPSLQHPERLGSTLRHFLYRCFEVEPLCRASAQELLQHPFMDSGQPIDTLLPMIHASIHPYHGTII